MPDLFTKIKVVSTITVVSVVMLITVIWRRRYKAKMKNQSQIKNGSTTEVAQELSSNNIVVNQIIKDESTQPNDSTLILVRETIRKVQVKEQFTPEIFEPSNNPKPLDSDLQLLHDNETDYPSIEAEQIIKVTDQAADEKRTSFTGYEPISKRKISPEIRGGSSRGSHTTKTEEPSSKKEQRQYKPELICWQQSRKWFIGIEVQSLQRDNPEIVVMQSNNQLSTETSEIYWPIHDMFDTITITGLETDEKFNLQLANQQKPFLLFKLEGENLKTGRQVKYTSKGFYLVITPKDWIRDTNRSGIAQIPASPCHISGFEAHYFHLESDSYERIVFLTSDHKEIVIPNSTSYFELRGNKIEEMSDNMGPLFGEAPPFLISNDSKVWTNIKMIVIGEEGKNSSGWRTLVKPEGLNKEINLQPYLKYKDSGWFFLRIYDLNDELIESIDFRFVKNLHAIHIDNSKILPDEDGHKSIVITFLFDNMDSCKILPVEHKIRPVMESASEIRFELPPEPEFDRTEWVIISESGTKVNISILVERIWWTVCKRNTLPEQFQWQDRYCKLNPEYFKATSEYVIRIKFPKARWIKAISIGFVKKLSRKYIVEVTKQTLEVPLNHFEGANQVYDTLQDHPLFIWLDNGFEHKIAILQCIKFKCALEQCNSILKKNEVIDHLTKFHHYDSLIISVNEWTEYRNYFKDIIDDIPHTIYLCRHCNRYINADNEFYPTDKIIHHIEGEHSGKRISFLVLKEVDKIRDAILHTLPLLFKCLHNDQYFETEVPSEIWKHYFENHRNELIKEYTLETSI